MHAATQISSFLLFPTITFAIASFIRLADPGFTRFNPYAIVGMVVMGVIPTTVSSNVVMTGQAGGDQSAATIEVMLGNLLGTFLSPALLQMFLSSSKWSFGKPVASGGGGTGELYRQVIEQLGFSVFIPLFVGEVIQWIWPRQVKWVRTHCRLAKIGTLCLLGVIWSTFSTAFAAGAFQVLSWETVVMLVVSLSCALLDSHGGTPLKQFLVAISSSTSCCTGSSRCSCSHWRGGSRYRSASAPARAPLGRSSRPRSPSPCYSAAQPRVWPWEGRKPALN